MSVARFVRGLDLSDHNLRIGLALKGLDEMINLEWINLNRTGLDHIPTELFKLSKLKRLTLSNNQIDRLNSELANLVELQNLKASRNSIYEFPESFFRRMNIKTLVLSHNNLKELPENIHQSKELTTLALADNQITEITTEACRRLTNLTYLDLSQNYIKTVPIQFRRLEKLQILSLANNPLGECNLTCIFTLKLVKLNLAATERNVSMFPPEFQQLSHTLVDLDLSGNNLEIVPVALYALDKLQRLNLGYNKLVSTSLLPSSSLNWPLLETLILSGNNFDVIPPVICSMSQLRRLYLNYNQIKLAGIPKKLGRLQHLHTICLNGNKLESLPRFICLMPLRHLYLRDNELTSLPVEIHLLIDNAKHCELSGNPYLKMPPKPREHVQKSEFYTADFSLEASEKYAARVLAEEQASEKKSQEKVQSYKDASVDSNDQTSQILKAMAEQAGTQSDTKSRIFAGEAEASSYVPPPPKHWTDALSKPALDYTSIFEKDVGKEPGVLVFIIESLNPQEVESSNRGKFCIADCYIVLHTLMNERGQLEYDIFYWIGSKATIDKRACSAIHAVNLRNHLGTRSKDVRVLQGEEPPEFSALFRRVEYLDETKATESGLFKVEFSEHPTRLFVLVFDGRRVKLDQIEPRLSALLTTSVYVLETKNEIFIWLGAKSTIQARAKVRLLAETINSNDYKSRATIIVLEEKDERNKSLARFKTFILEQEQESRRLEEEEKKIIASKEQGNKAIASTAEPAAQETKSDHNEAQAETAPETVGELLLPPSSQLNNFEREVVDGLQATKILEARKNTLYKVVFGQGYLELPQVHGRLKKDMLLPDCCFILDTNAQVFVWVGRKTLRDTRLAAQKLALEIYHMIPRPKWAKISRVIDRAETEMFKNLFDDWQEVIKVDHSKRVGEVSAVDAPARLDVDVRALYKPPQGPVDPVVAENYIAQANESLIGMNCFVFDGRKFKSVPPEEKGVFYSMDVYAFLCKYRRDDEEEDEEDDEEEEDGEDDGDEEGEEEEEDENNDDGDDKKKEEPKPQLTKPQPQTTQPTPSKTKPEQSAARFDSVLYYWEGRTASPMGWLNFKFQFQKAIEEAVPGTNLKVVRTAQQKEPLKLMAHFDKKTVIHLGPRNQAATKANGVTMYHVRYGTTIISTRAVEVAVSPKALVSRDCFLIRDPFSHVITLWIGRGATKLEEDLARSLANLLPVGQEKAPYRLQTVLEGQETGAFWLLIGGMSAYESALSVNKLPLRPRLFRCSNASGVFKVYETIDFCQDDLTADDVMIVDPGAPFSLFMWVGPDASVAEALLSKQAVEVYLAQCNDGRKESTHCIRVTKSNEPLAFKALFHGWSEEVRSEGPTNEFLRHERLVTGHVIEE